jgi:hypothetical protein
MQEITTSLSRAACIERLSAVLDPSIEVSDPQPVVGWVNKRALRLRKRIKGRNSFQPLLTGRFSDTPDGGVRIAFRTGMALSVKIFMAIFGTLCLVYAAIFAMAGEGIAFLPLTVFACMIGMVVIAQMIAKDEALFLIDFLRRTVQATEA